MGGAASKAKPESSAENVQSSVLQSSSGFHIMEIHFPTLGAGIGLVVVGAIMLHLCTRRYWRRRPRHSAAFRKSNQCHQPAPPAYEEGVATNHQIHQPHLPMQPMGMHIAQFHQPHLPMQPMGMHIAQFGQPFGPPARVPRITVIDEEEPEAGPSKTKTKTKTTG